MTKPGFMRTWRAPKWMPRFIRSRFMGVWTKAEVDEINRRAHERWLEFQQYVD